MRVSRLRQRRYELGQGTSSDKYAADSGRHQPRRDAIDLRKRTRLRGSTTVKLRLPHACESASYCPPVSGRSQTTPEPTSPHPHSSAHATSSRRVADRSGTREVTRSAGCGPASCA
jgi:hypothetical protein